MPRSSSGSCWAVLLGAGKGLRFGGPKLLALLEGRPLMAHALDAIAAARRAESLAGGVAVVPAGETQLAELAREAGLVVVENCEPAAGLGLSLRLGLARLAESDLAPVPAAAVVFLADQPRVRPEVVAALGAAWHGRARQRPGDAGLGARQILRPRYAEELDVPGHPVLLGRSMWKLAEGLEGDDGLGRLLEAHPEWVETLDVPGRNPDVDTAADLSALREPSSMAETPADC